MADNFKIDWDNVAKEQKDKKEEIKSVDKQVEKPIESVNETVEEKTEIVEDGETGKQKRKKPFIKTKFEKHKIRPVNFTAWILIMLSNIFAAGATCFIVFKSIGGVLGNGGSLSAMFGKEATAYTLGLVPFLGIVIYILMVGFMLLLATVAFLSIFYAFRNAINVGRLNYAKDEDYTKNVLIIKSIMRLLFFTLLTALLFFYFKTFKGGNSTLEIISIISAVIMVVCAIMLIVELIVAKSRYLKNTPKEISYPVMLEKKKLVRQYFFKRGNAIQKNFGNEKGLY